MEKFDAKMIENDFSEGEEMKIKVEIRRCQIEEFKRRMTDLTDGKVKFLSQDAFA
jgi:putative IMPACT (imprinted ancient) family translation regulator